MSEKPAIAIYASLSKKKTREDQDDRAGEESIESQVAKVRTRLTVVYPDGYDEVGVYDDHGHSGSKKNRGPALEAAISAVVAAAEGRDDVELWANTSARFARGTGKRNEARAVGELFYDLRRRGVAMRAVEDDEFVTNEMLVGFASAQASKYTKDLSESVSRAKRRQAERGEHLGGPTPIGYTRSGRKRIVIDEATAPTVRRIFSLAKQGVPDGALARLINKEGDRSRAGRPFDRRAVQSIICNPFYAGLIVFEGEEFEGQHKAVVSENNWRAIQTTRKARDHAKPDQHRAGAPARRHLLAKLAACGTCGSPLFAFTSSYKRKDGTHARQYRCRGYSMSDGTCDARFDAELIDTAVMERLHDLLPDFDRWIAQIEDRHAQERERLVQMLERAGRDRDEQDRQAGLHERRYRDAVAAGDETMADLTLEFVRDARRALDAAETRLSATSDALDSVPVAASRDRLLDFALNLREAIRGRTEGIHSVEEINRALTESFECFVIWDDAAPRQVDPGWDESEYDWTKPSLPEDEGVHASRIKIDPQIRPEVAYELLNAGSEGPAPIAPPLEWIEALRESANAQE